MRFQSQAQTPPRARSVFVFVALAQFHAPAPVDRLFARGAIAGDRTPPFKGWLKLNAACRFAASSRCSHQTMIGLAMAIEEYVPKITPMNSASENARSTSPPKS